MQGCLIAVLDGFATGDTDRSANHLDLEIGFSDPGYFGDGHDIIALSEDVDRRVSPTGTWTGAQPPACAERVERLLELQQRVERIGKQSRHP